MQIVIGFRQVSMAEIHAQIRQKGVEVFALLDPQIEAFDRECMSKIVDAGSTSRAEVSGLGLIPEKMKPAIYRAHGIVFAISIREESDPVRQNPADFVVINPA